MGEAREKISVEFHLDEEGKVVDITSANATCSEGDPQSPHAWASAIISTKHSPGCIYIWNGTRWIKICS
jgi:hypothetical protein